MKAQGMRRAKSLVESSEHMQTLKLLELKLSGKSSQVPEEPEVSVSSQPTKPLPPPMAVPPPPPPPPAPPFTESIYTSRIESGEDLGLGAVTEEVCAGCSSFICVYFLLKPSL